MRLPSHRVPAFVSATATLFLWMPAWAWQMDPTDPYGLKPKPPAEQKPAEKPKAEKPPEKQAAPGVHELIAPSGAGLSPEDIENQVRSQQSKAGKTEAESGPMRLTQGGVPLDRLGVSIPAIPNFPVADVLAEPSIFEGQTLRLIGKVRRECNTGCWVEIAEFKKAPKGIRVIPKEKKWSFIPSAQAREVTAYGLLRKVKLNAKDARAVDEESNTKPTGARTEWILEAEGAEVRWLD